MLDTAEQINLVRLARLGQNLFGLVTLFSREDRVGLCMITVSHMLYEKRNLSTKKTQLTSRGNGQRALNRCQLLSVHETRVGQIGGIHTVLLKQTNSVFSL
jgi:hypothetical protein